MKLNLLLLTLALPLLNFYAPLDVLEYTYINHAQNILPGVLQQPMGGVKIHILYIASDKYYYCELRSQPYTGQQLVTVTVMAIGQIGVTNP